MAGVNLDDYNDVAARLVEFREKHPEGSLQPANLAEPFQVVTIGDKIFVVYTAAAYRSPDDQRPGVGIAWEPVPGRTPYTRDSELQNAETSAWGRAIVAALAADTRKGIASREEVQGRQGEPAAPAQQSRPAPGTAAKAAQGVENGVPTVEAIEGLTALDDARALVMACSERYKTLVKHVASQRHGSWGELWNDPDLTAWSVVLLDVCAQMAVQGGEAA